MAKFYIQLQGKLVPVGKITEEDIKEALGVEQLFNFSGEFYELDNNPFKDESNGELKIVDPEGRIIAIVDKDGIHSIEMTAEDEYGTVHKLTDKMDKADFDEIISMDGNDFVIQDGDGYEGFVLNGEGATAHDFITYKGDSLLNIADRVESVESNVGSIDNMISATGNEFIIQDDKANPNVGLKLNSEGLFVKDVTLNNGEHVLSLKADKTYVDDVKSDMTTELNTKINSLDATVSASGRTYGVKVSVAQTNGKLSSVTVDDSAITFTKLVDNPIKTDTSDFIIQDDKGNKGFVLNDEGAKAKDFITSTGVSLNGLNTTVVSIRTEVDNINNMISAEEEGSLIIRDDNGNVGLKLNDKGLQVQDVTAVVSGTTHVLSEKADQSDVDSLGTEISVRIDDLSATVSENEKDIESKFTTLSKTVSDNESDIESKFTTLSTTVTTHKTELDTTISALTSTVASNKAELSNRISENTANINTNVNNIAAVNTRIDNLTTKVSDSGYGVTVVVSQVSGKITNISVDDSGITFDTLLSNPITREAKDDRFVITDASGNYGLVLDSTGLQVQDVTAVVSGTTHVLSSKADKDYVDDVDERLATIEGLLEEDNDGVIDNLKDVIDFFENVRDTNTGAALLSTVATHTTQISDNASGISTNASNITTLTSTVASHKKELDGKITTLSNLVNTNKEDINNTIASLTTTVSGSGSTYGVEVKVEQNKGLITKVSVNDSAIDFYKLTSNPIENLEDGKFVITDMSANYGLKLDGDGLHVQDVIAYGDDINGIHTLSSKADKDYVDDSISDVNEGIATLAGTVSALSTRVSATEKSISSLSGRVSANEGAISGLSSTVGTHTTSITTLNSTVASHKKELDGSIGDLTSTVTSNKDELDGKITALSKTVASNKAALDGSIGDLSNIVTAHTSDIATINVGVASHTKTIASLSGRVDTTEVSISSLNTTVGTHTTSITTLNSTVASHKKELDGSISDLTSTVTSHTSDISTLQTTVASNVSKINSLSGTVSANTAAISNINNITSASAKINSDSGTPTVIVSYTGETSNKKLNFEFKNLKGDPGEPGSPGVGISSVKQTTTSTVDEGENKITVTLTNSTSSVFTVKNGSKGSTGAGISAITKKNTNNLVDTYEITYTDGRAATSFQVANGAPGADVTITSISQNKTAGSYSTVSFSTGNKLDIYNGENGAKGSDGYSTYYTSVSATQGLQTVSLSTVTKPSDRTIQVGDFILAPTGNMFRVTGVNDTNASISYLTSIKGETGPKGDDGTSVNIKGTLNGTSDLKNKQDGAVNGDGYLIDGYLYVYTGSGQTYGFENVGEIKGPQGETGPQGPEGPAGTSVTIKSLVSSSVPGEASTITFSNNTTLKVYNGADGGQGPAGVGISSITKKGDTVNLVDTYEITYTDPQKTKDTFTVTNGAPGAPGNPGDPGAAGVGILSVSQKYKSEVDEGENEIVVTLTNEDEYTFIIKNGSQGPQGPKGEKGADGTSVKIKDTLDSTEDLKGKQSSAVNGDGYIIGENLYVYTGGSGTDIYYGFKNVGKIKGPKGDSITIKPEEVDGGYKFIINNVSEGTGDGSGGGVFIGDIFYEDILDAPITMDDSGVLDIADDAGYIIAKINSDGITTTKVKAKNGFYQESDETLKDFHDSIEVDFNALKSIPKAYYTWKGDNVKQIGTSAQKVQEIYPELVSVNEETGKLTMDYAKLSVVALKAVDLLSDENKRLNSELETLRNEIDMIKSHLGL